MEMVPKEQLSEIYEKCRKREAKELQTKTDFASK